MLHLTLEITGNSILLRNEWPSRERS